MWRFDYRRLRINRLKMNNEDRARSVRILVTLVVRLAIKLIGL